MINSQAKSNSQRVENFNRVARISSSPLKHSRNPPECLTGWLKPLANHRNL
jgi:hypothetical protein